MKQVQGCEKFKNSENKWKKQLKAHKKKNKKLYSIAKKSGSRRELKNIKNIKAKDSNKQGDYSSNCSRDELYSNSSFSSNKD